MSYKILILEDNELLLETLEDFLVIKACDVSMAKNVEQAYELCFYNKFDIYLLDVKLPTSSGFEFLKNLRESENFTPAIFITSLGDKQSLVDGFMSGADDYIKKPFDLDELWLRIKAVISRGKALKEKTIIIDEVYSLHVSRKNVTCRGVDVIINLKDFELLHLLLLNRGKVVTREMIECTLWNTQENANTGSIRVYINNLKKIFGKNSISNIRGIGYRFEI